MKWLHMFNSNFLAPNKMNSSTRKRNMRGGAGVCAKMMLHGQKCKFNITTDAWSSCILKYILVIMIHRINDSMELKRIILDFLCFKTPHACEALRLLLQKVLKEWDMKSRVRFFTTEKASDICTKI